MSTMELSADQFEELGRRVARYKSSRSAKVTLRRFKAHFGAPPAVVADGWELLQESTFLQYHLNKCTKSPDPEHYLWALMLLKRYDTWEVLASAVGTHEQTVKKWAEIYLEAVARLDTDVIVWANRFFGDTGDRCLVTVDGTHFKIRNKMLPGTHSYNKAWYSHKFCHAGVSYEIAVCIKTGDIVWIHGPFPAATNDISIFRYWLRDVLRPWEKVIGDLGYIGDSKCVTPQDARNCQHKRSMAALRARHETVNRRFKTFGALTHCFRHPTSSHHIFFRAAAVLIQLGHQMGYSHYDVVGYVDPVTESDWL